MCLAVTAKVLYIQENRAKVDFGGGIIKEIDVTLVDVKVGEYVLVHAGYAIQVLSREQAEETIRLWNEIMEADEAQRADA